MASSFNLDVPAAEAAGVQAEIKLYLAQIKVLNEQIKHDQQEIDQLKQRAQQKLANLRRTA